jgi:phage portal protein BeeE
MGMFDGIRQALGFGIEEKQLLQDIPPTPQGGLLISELHDSILKAVQPKYLYKPPFGYPRPINTNALRELAKNPYIFSVIKTLADEAASTDWDILEKETNKDADITPNDEVREKITEFLKNPNINHESFRQLIYQAVVDILEVDAGVWVKVFNRKGDLVQLYARDGASFLKNIDIYGTMTNREPFVEPLPAVFIQGNKNYFGVGDEAVASEHLTQRYSIMYAAKAAYYQYGQAFAAWPIPFGTRELVYMQANPRADSIYGRSPLETLADIILTLVYGAKYNLDFYLNNNMSEGVLHLEGAKQEDINAFSERLTHTVRDDADSLGYRRRMGYRVAVTNYMPKFERFQLTPVEMEILAQQKWFDRIMLRCFGMTENEMGTTDDSNRATAHVQSQVFKRKALKPILNLIEYHINSQILTEFEGAEGWEFKFDDYDLDEDIKKHTLYEAQVRMGIKTAEMVAEEEGIDVDKLKQQKDEERMKQQEMFGDQPSFGNNNFSPKDNEETGEPQGKREEEEPKQKPEGKSHPEMNEIVEYIQAVGKMLDKELSQISDEDMLASTQLEKVKVNEA